MTLLQTLLIASLLAYGPPAVKQSKKTEKAPETHAYDDMEEPFRTACLHYWATGITNWNNRIVESKKLVRFSRTSAEKQRAKERLNQAEHRLAWLKKNDPPVYPNLPSRPVLGNCGEVDFFIVSRIIDEKTFLGEWGGDVVIVRGLETADLVDGQKVPNPPRCMFGVKETGKYGFRTLPILDVIEP